MYYARHQHDYLKKYRHTTTTTTTNTKQNTQETACNYTPYTTTKHSHSEEITQSMDIIHNLNKAAIYIIDIINFINLSLLHNKDHISLILNSYAGVIVQGKKQLTSKAQHHYLLFDSEIHATKAINKMNIWYRNVFDFKKVDKSKYSKIILAFNLNQDTISTPRNSQKNEFLDSEPTTWTEGNVSTSIKSYKTPEKTKMIQREKTRKITFKKPSYLLLDETIENNLKTCPKDWTLLSLIIAQTTHISTQFWEIKKHKFFKAVTEIDGILGLEYIIDDEHETLAIVYETERHAKTTAFKFNRLCLEQNKDKRGTQFFITFRQALEKKNLWINRFPGLTDITFNTKSVQLSDTVSTTQDMFMQHSEVTDNNAGTIKHDNNQQEKKTLKHKLVGHPWKGYRNK